MTSKPHDVHLTPDECGQARTPEELHQWVLGKFTQIGATEAGKTAIRLKVGRLKRFVDEIYPLAVFGHRFLGGRPGVKLQWLEGNENRDALLIDSSTTPPRKVVVESTAINRWALLDQKLGHIRKALALKSAKPYPPDTVLLVAVDDSRLMEPGDPAEIRRVVFQAIQDLKPRFSDLYVFGFTGYIAEHFPLRLTPSG